MSTSPQVMPAPKWLRMPTLESGDETVREFMKTHLNHMSPRRRFQTQRAAKNLWFYLGRQWIREVATLVGTNGAYQFQEIFPESNASFPRPVTNYVGVAVDNEVSRLTRKEYVPDTSAGKNNPEWMAAARLAKDILMYEISKQVWDDKREHAIFNLIIESIVIVRSWWDENNVEVTLVASPDAVKCPMCNRFYASSKIPRLFTQTGIPVPSDADPGIASRMMEPFHSETFEDVEPTGEMTAQQAEDVAMLQMRNCPYCEQTSLLQPFEMSEKEAGGLDAFNRPMGLLVPRGEGMIDVLTVHEWFPENGGLGLEPHQQRIHGQVKVRPLEWIALRFPEFRDDLDREDPGLLLRYNPMYAEQSFQSGMGYGLGVGEESYYNHSRVFETVIEPQPIQGLELGAHFAMVGDKIVRRPLCVEVQTPDNKTKLVPRVKYHFARFKRIPGNCWGRTFVDDMLPLQCRLNEIDAMGCDIRERGKPNIWTPEGTELYFDDESGKVVGSYNIIEYDSPIATWSPKDGLFPGVPMNGTPYAEERAQVLRDMQALGAPQDIEMGQSPGSVKTTSGLMLLSEEASQKRAPRERAMIRLYESVFEHLLELNWAFRKEDATYEVQREGGIYEQASYTGSDLLGNIRVKMAARVNYDQTLYNKEAASEALQMGLYKLDSPAAIDRILDLMKLPKDVNENQTLQITRAEMAWTNFVKQGVVAPIDPSIHDALTWYAVLGKRWFGDEAYSMQQRLGWEMLIPRLVGWEEQMAQMEMAEAPYAQFPPEQWGQIEAQGNAMVKQAMTAYQQADASFQESQKSAPPGAPPPIPPQKPAIEQFPPAPTSVLPKPLELKIYTVWRRMLPEFEAALGAAAIVAAKKDLVEPTPEATKIQELDGLLKMRATIEAYRMLATASTVGPGGPMAPPAPGGPVGAPPVGGAPGAPGGQPAAGPPGPPGV